MNKRCRKRTDFPTIINSSSSSPSNDEYPTRIKKYVRQKRRHTVEVHISESSSDEQLLEQDQSEQENRTWMPNLKRYSSDPKPLTLTQHNKYQPLSLSVIVKSPSPSPLKRANLLEISTCSTASPASSPATSRKAWQSFRHTFSALKRNPFAPRLAGSSRENTMDESLLDCSLNTSLDATMNDSQQTQSAGKRVLKKKLRCRKGGYLYEFKRMMLRERKDCCTLAQNQRLGLTSGQRAHVLDMQESFGVHMARVQTEEEDIREFNVIIPPSMAVTTSAGSTLELFFDLQSQTALELSNEQLVFVNPSKLVLLCNHLQNTKG